MGYTEEAQGKRGSIFSINCSRIKGTSKQAVKKARLIEEFGLEQDVHSGPGLRQVSLLAIESITRQMGCPKAKKKDITLGPGDFAENITTIGLNLSDLKIGMSIRLGSDAVLEVSKIGKECHKYCAVYQKVGDCIMPREGIFAKVIKGGDISIGDNMEVINGVSNRV